MSSSFRNLKILFTILSGVSIIFSCVGIFGLHFDSHYMEKTTLIACYMIFLLFPVLFISIRVLLKILDNEMESESYGISRRMIDLETKLEELENKLAEIQPKKTK